MNPIPCAPCCSTPQTVNIPGIQGPAGPVGPAGTTLVVPTTSYAGAPTAGGTEPIQNIIVSMFNILAVAVSLPRSGTWLIWARLNAKLTGATISGTPTLTAKLRCTTRSTDLSWSTITLPAGSALGLSLPQIVLPVIYYVGTAGDTIQLFAAVSAVPSPGTVDANEAEIVALQII